MKNNNSTVCKHLLLPFLADEDVLKDCDTYDTATALVQFLKMVSLMDDNALIFESILTLANVPMNLSQYRNSVMDISDRKQLKSLKEYRKKFSSEQLIRVYYALSRQMIARNFNQDDPIDEVIFIYKMTLLIHRNILQYTTKNNNYAKTVISDTTKI